MHSQREVEDAVFAAIEDLSQRHRSQIDPSASLVQDLQITGDDVTFVFVPEVERALGVKIQPETWRQVRTVQDAIDLLTNGV